MPVALQGHCEPPPAAFPNVPWIGSHGVTGHCTRGRANPPTAPHPLSVKRQVQGLRQEREGPGGSGDREEKQVTLRCRARCTEDLRSQSEALALAQAGESIREQSGRI